MRRGELLRFFETASGGLIVSDGQGLIVAANATACRMFGYDKKDLIGASVELLVPDRLRHGHASHRHHFRTAPKTCRMGPNMELLGRRRDSTEFPIEVDLHPIDTRDGLRIVSMIRDALPEKLVRDRLKASIAEQSALLREINHRVRNNMQVLLSLLSLQKEGLDPHSRAVLDHASVQVHAMSLVHEALASGVGPLIDLGKYLNSLVFEVARGHAPTSGRVQLEARLEPIEVRYDDAFIAGRIVHEAVWNSLTRAFGAGRAGTIIVSLARLGDEVVLSVADDGGGTLDSATPFWRDPNLLRELIARLGGTLEIQRNVATTIIVRWHYPASPVEAPT